jgi:hypothetical protein
MIIRGQDNGRLAKREDVFEIKEVHVQGRWNCELGKYRTYLKKIGCASRTRVNFSQIGHGHESTEIWSDKAQVIYFICVQVCVQVKKFLACCKN